MSQSVQDITFSALLEFSVNIWKLKTRFFFPMHLVILQRGKWTVFLYAVMVCQFLSNQAHLQLPKEKLLTFQILTLVAIYS